MAVIPRRAGEGPVAASPFDDEARLGTAFAVSCLVWDPLRLCERCQAAPEGDLWRIQHERLQGRSGGSHRQASAATGQCFGTFLAYSLSRSQP